jgi:hypothetical protein
MIVKREWLFLVNSDANEFASKLTVALNDGWEQATEPYCELGVSDARVVERWYCTLYRDVDQRERCETCGSPA